MRLSTAFLFCLLISSFSARGFSGNESQVRTSNAIYPADSSTIKPKRSVFFVDFIGFGVSETAWGSYLGAGVNEYVQFKSYGGGGQIRFGNKFYLNPYKKNVYLGITWLRGGLCFFDGLFLVSGPLHPTIGYTFNINKSFSIQPSLSGGWTIIGPGIFSESVETGLAFFPEVKFNYNQFVFGIEYSRYKDQNSIFIPEPPVLNYFSASLGFQL